MVFTLGSGLCALAANSGELIAFRVLQGVGGGMLTPIGQMILVKAAGPRNLPKVMSLIGIPIVLAPVFGPDPRRPAAAVRRLAVDLHDQRADRRARADDGLAAPAP